MNIPFRSVFVFATLAGATFLAGCASDPAAAAKAKADKEEYVTVMTTGSNIPVRIKKSDLEKGQVTKGILADNIDKDDFARNAVPRQTSPTASGGK
jgi:hypothetical protein